MYTITMQICIHLHWYTLISANTWLIRHIWMSLITCTSGAYVCNYTVNAAYVYDYTVNMYTFTLVYTFFCAYIINHTHLNASCHVFKWWYMYTSANACVSICVYMYVELWCRKSMVQCIVINHLRIFCLTYVKKYYYAYAHMHNGSLPIFLSIHILEDICRYVYTRYMCMLCIYIYIYIYMYMHIHAWININVYIYIYIYIHSAAGRLPTFFLYTFFEACVYEYIHTHIYVYVYIYIYTHIHVDAYTYI